MFMVKKQLNMILKMLWWRFIIELSLEDFRRVRKIILENLDLSFFDERFDKTTEIEQK